MTRIVQRLVRDKAGFLDFLSDGQELIARLVSGDADEVEAKRLVHTIKGNCGVFGILSMYDLCDGIESRSQDESRAISQKDARQIESTWDGITKKVRELLGESGESRIEIDDDEYVTIIRKILSGAPRKAILQMVATWRLERMQVRLQRLADQARGLATRLGKAPIDVSVDDNGLRLPSQVWSPFWSTVVHLLRNAVDHGLETPDERERAGKGRGQILLTTRIEGDTVLFECEDDGRGIDWEALRKKGRALGLPTTTHDELVALMLRDGMSTRESATSTSGRGVGLSAVMQACKSLGGDVRVRSHPGRGTSFQFRFPHTTAIDASAEALISETIATSLGPEALTVRPSGTSMFGDRI
jgi:two-component system chemotaxis sensor kinase CheA